MAARAKKYLTVIKGENIRQKLFGSKEYGKDLPHYCFTSQKGPFAPTVWVKIDREQCDPNNTLNADHTTKGHYEGRFIGNDTFEYYGYYPDDEVHKLIDLGLSQHEITKTQISIKRYEMPLHGYNKTLILNENLYDGQEVDRDGKPVLARLKNLKKQQIHEKGSNVEIVIPFEEEGTLRYGHMYVQRKDILASRDNNSRDILLVNHDYNVYFSDRLKSGKRSAEEIATAYNTARENYRKSKSKEVMSKFGDAQEEEQVETALPSDISEGLGE